MIGRRVLKAHHDDIEIACETFGGPPGDPLLLVMGIGAQMVLVLHAEGEIPDAAHSLHRR